MEQMYDKKVEGIIVRSRARWYEHGETFYIFLERKNGTIFITYDVQILVEKNFNKRLNKIRNAINLWK